MTTESGSTAGGDRGGDDTRGADGAPRVFLVTEAGASPDLERALGNSGLGVDVAAHGAPPREVAAAVNGQALALVDLSDPERAAEVAAALAGCRTPVLVAVPPEDERAMELAFAAGARDVLARPGQAGYEARRIAQLVRRARLAEPPADGRRGSQPSAGRTASPALADRRQLAENLARACEQARNEASTVALLHIELDGYRELIHGLPTGSAAAVLAVVAARLGHTTRGTDTVAGEQPHRQTIARVGGGEFCIVLQGLTRSEDAAKAARRILDALSDPLELPSDIAGRSVELVANVGIACYPGENRTPEELVDCARMATENARQDGSGNVRFYAPSMNVRAFERLSLESGMRRALEEDQFRVYYQPRIEISSGRIVGLEALVRWQHPELGLVSPGQFIPLAEETGLIVPIGESVLRSACNQAREWQRRGLPPVSISVNLSSVQFQQPELFDTVVRVLGESGLDPSWLELELTESLLMQHVESVVSTLKRFRDTGIRLSIDDFGTGYSSLAYLKRFPIDALKIDRSFIREVTTNADDAALATSIILMGRSLKLKVVAEGVETASQLSFLRIMQCDEAQGFLYSPPVPAADAERLLREGCNPLAA